MYSAFPTILTTIAINILNKVGVDQSFVFAPIPILLSLADHPDAASNHIFNGIPSLNTTLLFEHANIIETQSNKRPWYLPPRKESYLHRQYYSMDGPTNSTKKKFEKYANRYEYRMFISLNLELNKYLSCRKKGPRMAKDNDFEVLEIRLNEDPLRFVAFLPTNESFLSENLHKLDTTRFHDLLGKLDYMFIDFEIPYFELKTRINLSPLLEIPSNATHEYEHNFPKLNTPGGGRDGFPKRSCETERYFFELNRPFLFSVLNGTIPLVMGVFTGNNK
ncbi:unnamed protein product [Caenorhabditis brenneri]